MDELISVINSVGFPIVACFYLAKNNKDLITSIGQLTNTLQNIDNRLENVERKVNG